MSSLLPLPAGPLQIVGLAAGSLIFGLSLCGGKKPKVDPAAQPAGGQAAAPFRFGGLELELTADPALNRFEGQGQSLLLVVYQLSGPAAFQQQAKSEAGLQTLLKGGAFDATVVSGERVFLQPGERQRLKLDRGQNVCWLGLVAGYGRLEPGACTRLVSLCAGAGEGARSLKVEADLGPVSLGRVRCFAEILP